MMHTGVVPFCNQQVQYPPGMIMPLNSAPKIVPDQRNKFHNDQEVFQKLVVPSKVKFIGYMDCPIDQRKHFFVNDCRQGFCKELSFTNTGIKFNLFDLQHGECNFGKEFGKVHIRSHRLIFNGVCVIWVGWIDLETLEGVAYLEYDEVHAAEWEAKLSGHTKMDLT